MATNTKLRPQYVIDASAILSTILPDEKTPNNISQILNAYSKKDTQLSSPSLLKFEVGNALKSAVIQKRLSASLASKIFSLFLKLPIDYQQINNIQTLQLSLTHKLSFYDAAYLHLSQKLKCPLISLDKKLTQLSHA